MLHNIIAFYLTLNFPLVLTTEDIASIDAAGAVGAKRLTAKTFVKRAAAVALVGAAALGVCPYLGIDVL